MNAYFVSDGREMKRVGILFAEVKTFSKGWAFVLVDEPGGRATRRIDAEALRRQGIELEGQSFQILFRRKREHGVEWVTVEYQPIVRMEARVQ